MENFTKGRQEQSHMFGFPPIIRIFMHLRAGRLLNGEKSIEVTSVRLKIE